MRAGGSQKLAGPRNFKISGRSRIAKPTVAHRPETFINLALRCDAVPVALPAPTK